MYSRRFYGGERFRQSHMPQNPEPLPVKRSPAPEKKAASSDLFARYPTETERGKNPPMPRETEIYPRDFYPRSERALATPALSLKEEPKDVSAASDRVSESATGLSDIKNMNFEDMLLSGLLMLGGTSNIDEEIMIILGLMLIIGT